MKLNLCFLIAGLFLFVACGGNGVRTNQKKFAFDSRKHYLLTNKISIKGRESVTGASSYLVEINGKLYLSTARHLTGGAMGFNPAIDLKTYSDSVDFWKAYVRGNIIDDTVVTRALLYHPDDIYDIVLLEVNKKPGKIDVLKPEFKKLSRGDKILVLGCEYSDASCVQNTFVAKVTRYTEIDQLEAIVEEKNIDLAGFSGAPALDENGKVIGHVLAGGEISDGKFVLYLAPIHQAKLVLKSQKKK